MCLMAMSIDQSRRFPLVLAANRDEYFSRPTARLSWWQPEGAPHPILSGRDLLHGGTWLGLNALGRLALVTNVRSTLVPDLQAPSRGQIVLDWLAEREPADRFWMRTALSGYNGFNLVALDFKDSQYFYASNLSAHPVHLKAGLFGLSNGLMSEATWPKVTILKARVLDALEQSGPDTSVDQLAQALFAALADRTAAPDDQLPHTGWPIERERALSAPFIRLPDGLYGTRSCTLIITERVQRRLVTHVLERTVSPTGHLALIRRAQLKRWPPRPSDLPCELEPISEDESPMPAEGAPPPPLKRTRARRLLRPR